MKRENEQFPWYDPEWHTKMKQAALDANRGLGGTFTWNEITEILPPNKNLIAYFDGLDGIVVAEGTSLIFQDVEGRRHFIDLVITAEDKDRTDWKIGVKVD